MLSTLIDQLAAAQGARPAKPGRAVTPVTRPSGRPNNPATIEALMCDREARSTRAIANALGIDRDVVVVTARRMAQLGILRQRGFTLVGHTRARCVVWVWIPEADRG